MQIMYQRLSVSVYKGYTVGQGGLEPPTSPLSGVRSNQLSYRPEPIENCYRQLVVPGPAIKEPQLAIIKMPF